jgi:choline dehydrogenase-like flavoprotein
MDHISTPLMFLINQSLSIQEKNALTISALNSWFLAREGPLASPSGLEALGNIYTKYQDQSQDWPDFQILFAALSWLTDSGTILRVTSGLTAEAWSRIKPFDGQESYTMLPMLYRPKSRGYIKLRSTNPYEAPVIDPKYYSHPDDLKSMVEAIKIALALANTPPLKKYGSVYLGEKATFPSCDVYKHFPTSEEALECQAKAQTFTIYHPVGTCKMGSPFDPMAVVGPDLRVLKVKGLRIADASVMPQIVSCNTNAATIVIGEKGADLIKSSRGPLSKKWVNSVWRK